MLNVVLNDLDRNMQMPFLSCRLEESTHLNAVCEISFVGLDRCIEAPILEGHGVKQATQSLDAQFVVRVASLIGNAVFQCVVRSIAIQEMCGLDDIPLTC